MSARKGGRAAALKRIADPKNWGGDGGWVGDSYPDEIAQAALASPDATLEALKHLAGLFEALHPNAESWGDYKAARAIIEAEGK